MATKTVNYTTEQTELLATGVAAGETVEALAAAVGKTVASVRAKLAQMGLYTSKAKAAKADKGERVTKANRALKLAIELGGDTQRTAEDLAKLRTETLTELETLLASYQDAMVLVREMGETD